MHEYDAFNFSAMAMDMTEMNNKPSKPSSFDVARHAGVSQSTVSRVFSPGHAKVAEKTRRKILDAARELNYQPGMMVQDFGKSGTKIIGVIVDKFENSFYTESIRHFTNVLQERGYTTMLLNSNLRELEEALPLALQYQVDGIILASSTLSPSLVMRCASLPISVVSYNRYSESLPMSAVGPDNFRIGKEMAEYLYRLGHRRMAFLGGNIEQIPPIKDRLAGFTQGLESKGLKLFASVLGDNTYQAGHALVQSLLAAETRPDVIFCCNYMVAFGAIDAARDKFGMSVPEDMSVVGFYDHPVTETSSYSLTTVRLPVADIAEGAVTILLNAIERKTNDVVMRMFPGKIVERGSVLDRNRV